MNIKDLFESKKLVMSAEVFPPKQTGKLEVVVRALKSIQSVNPDFVSITYGAGGEGADTTADVATIATDALGLNSVAHMTAVNMTIEKLENQLEILSKKGIHNILTLRGDLADTSKFHDFNYANELASYISKNHPEFTLLGACYPEKHPESKNIENDIDNLKRKVDAGISLLVTQMFFDNQKYFDFLNITKQKGINIPITAGIMPIINENQIDRIVTLSNASIPNKLQKMFNENKNSPEFYKQGLEYAANQIQNLIDNGCKGIHLYTMNKGDVATFIFDKFKGDRTCNQ